MVGGIYTYCICIFQGWVKLLLQRLLWGHTGLHDRRIPMNFPVKPLVSANISVHRMLLWQLCTFHGLPWPVHIASIMVFHSFILGIYMKCLAISLATWREEPGTQVALHPWRLIFDRNFRPTNHRKVKYASGRKSSVVWGTFSIHIYFTRFLRGPLLQKHASRARLSWQLFTFRNPQRGCSWLTQVVKYWAPNTSTKLLSLVSHTSPSRPK